MLARILTPPASKRCQAHVDQHMAAEDDTLQARWGMKEEIRGPIEKGAFISAPSSFNSIKCQGNTLLTSYLTNNDHNQNTSLPLVTPVAQTGRQRSLLSSEPNSISVCGHCAVHFRLGA